MLDENRIEDLTLFYQLLSRVHHGLKELCTSFAAYIKVRSHIVITCTSFAACIKVRSHIVITCTSFASRYVHSHT